MRRCKGVSTGGVDVMKCEAAETKTSRRKKKGEASKIHETDANRLVLVIFVHNFGGNLRVWLKGAAETGA